MLMPLSPTSELRTWAQGQFSSSVNLLNARLISHLFQWLLHLPGDRWLRAHASMSPFVKQTRTNGGGVSGVTGSCAPQTLLSQQLAVSWMLGHLAPLDGQTRQLSPGPQRTAALPVFTTDTLTAGEGEVVMVLHHPEGQCFSSDPSEAFHWLRALTLSNQMPVPPGVICSAATHWPRPAFPRSRTPAPAHRRPTAVPAETTVTRCNALIRTAARKVGERNTREDKMKK
ncbi:unnamed protein product [Lota lota]